METAEHIRKLSAAEYGALAAAVIRQLAQSDIDSKAAQTLIERPRILRAYLAVWMSEPPTQANGKKPYALETSQFRELCACIAKQMPHEVPDGMRENGYVDNPSWFGVHVANRIAQVPPLKVDRKARNVLVMKGFDVVDAMTRSSAKPHVWPCRHDWQRNVIERLLAEGRALADSQFDSYVMTADREWHPYDMAVHITADDLFLATIHHLLKFAQTNPGAEPKRIVALTPIHIDGKSYCPAWTPGMRESRFELIKLDSTKMWPATDQVLAVKPL